MVDVYIEDNRIFVMDLLKNIFYSILQNLNPDKCVEYISNKYDCTMVTIENIKFKSDYKIIQEPNVNIS